MKYCSDCRVKIDDGLSKCPLCLRIISPSSNSYNSEYPTYHIMDNTILEFWSKVLLFLFISISSITIFLNLFFWRGYPWFILVISSLFYIWILIKNTIVGRSHFGTKVIIQLFGISILLFTIDVLQNGISWSLNYVIPFLIILSNFIITVKIMSKKIKWRDYSVFLIILIILGFVPIIFFGFKLINILWPSALAALYTFLTFMGFFIFSFKRFNRELLKIFHI